MQPIFQEGQAQKRSLQLLQVSLPWLVLGLSLTVAAAIWQLERRNEWARATARFDREVERIERAVTDRIGLYERLLRAGRGVLDASPATSRADWHRFVGSLDLQTNYPGINGFGVVRHVPRAARAAFEAEQRARYPDFAIFPEGERDDYFVNTYLEPEAVAGSAIGFDAGANPVRRGAAERARDTGEPAVTTKVTLITPGRTGSDLLLYLAAYQGGSVPAGIEARRQALAGWIVIGLGIDAMMAETVRRHADIDIHIHDHIHDHIPGRAPAEGPLLYDSVPQPAKGGSEAAAPVFVRNVAVTVGGHAWMLACRSTPEFEAAAFNGQSTLILGAGVILSLLLGTTVRLLATGRSRALALARHMTAALRASEAKYRRIVETTSEGYWEVDAQARTVAVNDALCRLLGYARHEMIGRPLTAFTSGDGPLALAMPLFHDPQRSYEIDLVTKAGEVLHARVSATAWTDAAGRGQQGSFALVTDITLQKRLEQELRNDQERLRQILGAIPVALMITRPTDGAVLYVNRHAAELFGVPLDQTAGRRATEFYVDPADRERFVATARQDGKVESFEVQVRRQDGTPWWTILSARLFEYEGDPALLVGCQDITGRKRAEQALQASETRFRDMAANVPGLIYQWYERPDGGHGYHYVSPRCMDIFGVAAGDLVRDWQLLPIHPDDLPGWTASLRQAAERRSDWSFEGRFILPDGTVKWWRGVSKPVETHDGETVFNGMLIDISSQKAAAQELAEKTAELERSNAELQQFAYIASHDLREPLRMVNSYLQLLARRYQGRLDPEADEFIGYALDGARRMSRLIQDLLEYSRVGRMGEPPGPQPMAAVLHAALANLAAAVQDSAAVIRTPEALPVVWGRETDLTRLVQNLIGNALKYRDPSRPPEIRLDVVRQGGEWLFSVVDNGIGIAPEYFERIFLIFQRLHKRHDYEGTGIGLAVCRKIVENHGGRLWVESAPGRGSTFRFTLPARD